MANTDTHTQKELLKKLKECASDDDARLVQVKLDAINRTIESQTRALGELARAKSQISKGDTSLDAVVSSITEVLTSLMS